MRLNFLMLSVFVNPMTADALPIESVIPELVSQLEQHTRVILQAAPGAGKTTRIPLALMAQPWAQGQRILLLEPRRIATKHAAAYMAQSLGEPLGQRIGFRVRQEAKVSQATQVEVITQGILIRMLQDDPSLEGVAAVIFDEFHERSLDADLGLSLCLDVQRSLRQDLRLLVMSATLDTGGLRQLLGTDCPMLECPGRSWPVETHYRPGSTQQSLAEQVRLCVQEALVDAQGDILVFLPGQAEIRQCEAALADLAVQLTPLHGQLSLPQQQQALAARQGRHPKVILSTSIAETSLTIDGVDTVIDSGWQRLPLFQPRLGMTRLVTRRCSQASAEQRRGRAGRQGPGRCYRLWSREQPLIPHQDPEILQADLAPLVLELLAWGVKQPQQLDWLTPPPAAAFAQGRQLLMQLTMLDEQGSLTPLGQQAQQLGTHPRLAVMLVRSQALQAEGLAACLAALLEEGSQQSSTDIRSALLHPSPLQRQQAQRWADKLGVKPDWHPSPKVGELLALAFPERIGKALEPGRWQLASGQQAWVTEQDSLARQPWIVAVEVDGNPSRVRVYLAASLDESALARLYPSSQQWQQRVEWNEQEGRLQAWQEQAWLKLCLARKPLPQIPPQLKVPALLDAIRRRGLGTLPWQDTSRQLLARLKLLQGHLPDWPCWDDASLLEQLEDWLAPYLQGMHRLQDLNSLNLPSLLLNRLSWQQQQQLEEWAPSHFQVPSGSRIAIDYQADPPVLAVRLQEVFGLEHTPSVLKGRLPLLLHLLSPARRPIQITQDLVSFWAQGYHQVRKDLKGRYPKHYWPDDPYQAEAISGVRPRR